MALRQQIIQDRIEAIMHNLGSTKDHAFLRFAHSILTSQSIHAFDSADLVDGGQDKQIDAITIDLHPDEATIYILQAKYTDAFSSNILIQMHNGLEWIFNKPRADVAELPNLKLRDKIYEYRSILSDLGPSNIHIIVAFVTKGMTKEIAQEFHQEVKAIRDDYDNETFARFELLIWGAHELVEQLNNLEKRGRKINENVRIKYDANNPSLIRYHAQGLRGIVCTTPAREIARIVNNDPTGTIFDFNIRRFLGTRGAVNADILRACTDRSVGHEFWFLNNGITIVCDSFDAVTDPDTPIIKLKNMQIVNGCQTATTLAIAEQKGLLTSDVRVLLRIYEAPSPELVGKIVLATNNQNKISTQDLRANDPIQIDMEHTLATYGYHYERKPRQYDNQTQVDTQRIIPNELLAQCCLAVVLKKPSDARGRKYKIWSELYREIFSGEAIEPYIIAWQIYQQTVIWIKASGYMLDTNDLRRKLASMGTFFVARIASFLWRGNDQFRIDRSQLQQQIQTLGANPQVLNPDIGEAFALLESIIQKNSQYRSDLDKALKASPLETDIDRTLYARQNQNLSLRKNHDPSGQQLQLEM